GSVLPGTECFFRQRLLFQSSVAVLPGTPERQGLEAIVVWPNIGLRGAQIIGEYRPSIPYMALDGSMSLIIKNNLQLILRLCFRPRFRHKLVDDFRCEPSPMLTINPRWQCCPRRRRTRGGMRRDDRGFWQRREEGDTGLVLCTSDD